MNNLSQTVKGVMAGLAGILLGSALLGSSVRADEPPAPRLPPFFTSIEGIYDGRGTVRQMNAAGGMQVFNYTIRIHTEKSGIDNEWNVSNNLTTDTGSTHQNTAIFTVSGETLMVSNGGAAQMVEVTDVSPTSLTYKFRRMDVVGRLYEFVQHTELDAATHKLTGHNTVTTGTLVVSDEVFTATKW